MTTTLLIIGASRGLGHAIAHEFLQKGWQVIGTVRGLTTPTPLHELAQQYPDQLRLEMLDINDSQQLSELKERLAQRLGGQKLDMLFVNAGVTNRDPSQTIAEVSTQEFIEVMTTNALSPMRVLEALAPLVKPTGLLGVMSSGQGSISNNVAGQRELYRGSKAALNMFMRSFAARHPQRPLAVMAPGWIKTDLGGDDAPLTIQDSIPNLVNVLLDKQSRPGLEYLDYLGRTVPW